MCATVHNVCFVVFFSRRTQRLTNSPGAPHSRTPKPPRQLFFTNKQILSIDDAFFFVTSVIATIVINRGANPVRAIVVATKESRRTADRRAVPRTYRTLARLVVAA